MTDNRTKEPSEEQVEAAARAIADNLFSRWTLTSRVSASKDRGSLIHVAARAALEAAAGVAPQTPSGPTMTRFHASYPGMPELLHTYCAEHPEWGSCGEEGQARRGIAEHLAKEHAAPVQPSSTVDEAAKLHRPTLPGFGPKSCIHDGRAWPCPDSIALGLNKGENE